MASCQELSSGYCDKAFRERKLPAPWKIGIMKILYKVQDKDPQNLNRLLMLLPVLMTFYGKITNGRILGSLEKEASYTRDSGLGVVLWRDNDGSRG